MMFLNNYKETFSGAKIQVLCVICASLNAVSDGMHIAWSAPSASLLLNEESPFDVNEQYIVWLELLLTIFGILGLPPTIYLADKLGRKKAILLSSCASAVAWILIGIGNTKEFLFAARCLAGFSIDASFVTSPTYISEIANKNMRGFLVCTGYVMFHLGIIIMYTVGAQTSLRIPPIVGICIIIMQLLTLPHFPESPYHHIRNKNEEAARKSLVVFQEKENVETELSRIVEEVQRESEESSFRELFSIRKNRKVAFIILLLYTGPPLTGHAAILMNLHTILESVDKTLISPDKGALVYSSVILIASVFSALLVDKLGRKFLINISTFFPAVSILALGVYVHMKRLHFDLSGFDWIPLVSMNAYAAFFKMGLGTIYVLIGSEVSPPNIKTVVLAIADFLYNFSWFVSVYVYNYCNEHYGLEAVFYVFSLFSILVFILNIFFIPETKGKTLQEIQVMLEG